MPPPSHHPPIRTVEQAGAWLEGLINVEKERSVSYERFDLEPIRRLLARLGNPQLELSVIHIAGSKGKGSTALLSEAILTAAGETVGTFTSPHLERWTERFRIGGRDVEGERLAAAVDRVAPEVEALRADDPACAPTFFDATTAAALLLFREAAVERVVLEVGLGGRLDSTNVVDPVVTCVTSIELEHIEQLGNTQAAIAAEKAGIVKSGVPVVMGALSPDAAKVVEGRAAELAAPVAALGREFDVDVLEEGLDGQLLRLTDGPVDVRVRLGAVGRHQAANAALALACALRAAGPARAADLAAAAKSGLASVKLPGRIEILGRAPWVIVDSAHTAMSAQRLAHAVGLVPRRRAHLVLSVSAGKDAASILDQLLPHFDEVTVTRAEPIRSLAPQEVSAAIRAASPGIGVTVVPNPHLAVRAAREGLATDDLLCVAGSIYLAGIARGVLLVGDSAARVVVSGRSEDRAG